MELEERVNVAVSERLRLVGVSVKLRVKVAELWSSRAPSLTEAARSTKLMALRKMPEETAVSVRVTVSVSLPPVRVTVSVSSAVPFSFSSVAVSVMKAFP